MKLLGKILLCIVSYPIFIVIGGILGIVVLPISLIVEYLEE